MTIPANPPPVEAVVETGVYAADLDAAEAFYAGVLGRPGSAGRRVDTSSSGRRLLTVGIRPDTLADWRRPLTTSGIEIEKEYTWPRGGHSLYFRDPAGNSVEPVTPGV